MKIFAPGRIHAGDDLLSVDCVPVWANIEFNDAALSSLLVFRFAAVNTTVDRCGVMIKLPLAPAPSGSVTSSPIT